ncbi:MAG TPA: hypothetical protein PKC28_06690 [Bdellovibrionales bacterium]|nr:hypothetical protein [Bdellovibrionales bacterium]
MLIWLFLLLSQTVFAQSTAETDQAFLLIFKTPFGQEICRDVLGGDAEAIRLHLGVSPSKAKEIADGCHSGERSGWIYKTEPETIQKLLPEGRRQRTYRWLSVNADFPIESWTDPFRNLTTILKAPEDKGATWLLKILAHEMAVYFDSKANTIHPEHVKIPVLDSMSLGTASTLNPWVAVSDPQIAHSLTYLRALKVEYRIMSELKAMGKIRELPAEYSEPLIAKALAEDCDNACVLDFITNVRKIYRPISLTLLALAPQYRTAMMAELARLNWSGKKLITAQTMIDRYPVRYMLDNSMNDMVSDLTLTLMTDAKISQDNEAVARFFEQSIWPIEMAAIGESYFEEDGRALLTFLKEPLLSGHNIRLSTGPRVRIRTGNME